MIIFVYISLNCASSGYPIVPTEKLRISQHRPFYTSARKQDLSSSTLSLAGLSAQEVDNIAADIAIADATAACGMKSVGKSQNMSSRAKRRFATIYPGDREHFAAMAGAMAAVPRATWMLQNDHDDDDDAAQGNKSSSVVWLGRTGMLAFGGSICFDDECSGSGEMRCRNRN
jgi:hypothetical protein